MPKNQKDDGPGTDNPAPPVAIKIVPERIDFTTLLLGNPNHFGTFPNLGQKAIFPKSGDTAFEQVVCLGLNPEQNKLEAVVQIKQQSGYGSDACGAGSIEYVRFFVQHGATWVDLGEATVNVYSLAGSHPLSYSVSVPFNEPHKFCTVENILNVRAILSWSLEPTPGDATFSPPWGNVLDARVQVAKTLFSIVAIETLLNEGILKLDPGILKEIDVTKTLPPKPQPPEAFTALKALYAQEKVPAHRFGFTEALSILAKPVLDSIPDAVAVHPEPRAKAAAALTVAAELKAGPELAAILQALAVPAGDTTYEQLTCAGYNPQTRELEGVIQINRNAGYSGGLCSAGSTEYVSFFGFWLGTWHSLGTASVLVHDLAAVTPGHPVHYAVYRVSNIVEMPCGGLQGIPLRAILSWQTIPTGPGFLPHWGNIVNTFVQPIIGTVDGEQTRLMRIGGVTIDRISDVSHLAYPRDPMDSAHGLMQIVGDCPGDDSPFGGELIVEGDFLPRPDVFNHTTGALVPGGKPIIYQVWVTDLPGSAFQLTNSFNIAAFPPNALHPVTILQQALVAPGPVSGLPATDVFYRYFESDVQAVNPRTLVPFEAGGLPEGNYLIEVRGFAWNAALLIYQALPVQSKIVHVFNGYPHTEIVCVTPTTCIPTTLQRPDVAMMLTSVPDCADVTVTTTVTGSYSVTDRFFGSLNIKLVPITIGGNPTFEPPIAVTPDPGEAVSYNGSNTMGSHGTFTLDTTGMTPCGYNIELNAFDRAIVDSHCYSHWNRIGVGFCLRKQP